MQDNAQPMPVPPPPDVSSDTIVEVPVGKQETEAVVNPPSPNTPPKPKRKFPVGIFIALLLVILISIGGVFVYRFFTSGKSGTVSGEIVWWGLWEDDQILKNVITAYESKNPQVKIKYVRQSKEDYRERLVNALAKGSGPDIFRFHNSWVPTLRNELDKVPAKVFSASDFASQFYPVATSDLTVGSNLVGVPLEYDGLTLFVNEEIFEKSGKSIPVTWNELRQVARELTVIDQNRNITQSGVALGRTENVDHWPEILGLMMLQNGVNLNKPVGRLAEDALDFFTIFAKDDKVWNTTLPSSTVTFASGKLAMYFGPSWRAFEIREQNPNLRFKTVPVPQLPKTEANEPDVTYASYWVEGVWARSEKKDIAWDFLQYLSQDTQLRIFYQDASRVRLFGEPYPKVSLSGELSSHPIVGSIVVGAPFAQSWFLQSRTWDGPTGINTQINKYFENAINAVNDGKKPEQVLTTVASGVSQVLSAYGIRIQ